MLCFDVYVFYTIFQVNLNFFFVNLLLFLVVRQTISSSRLPFARKMKLSEPLNYRYDLFLFLYRESSQC